MAGLPCCLTTLYYAMKRGRRWMKRDARQDDKGTKGAHDEKCDKEIKERESERKVQVSCKSPIKAIERETK